MREAIALTVSTLLVIATARYCYLTVKKRIAPVITSWLLFALATTLSLATYLHSERHDIVRNIGNAVDVITVLTVTSFIAFSNRSEKGLNFKRREIVCLLASAVITVFWSVSHNDTISNLAIQGILLAGYLPLADHLWRAEENTEPTFIWAIYLVASTIALYLPIKEKDLLATIYNLRAVISVATVLFLILRIKFRQRKRGL